MLDSKPSSVCLHRICNSYIDKGGCKLSPCTSCAGGAIRFGTAQSATLLRPRRGVARIPGVGCPLGRRPSSLASRSFSPISSLLRVNFRQSLRLLSRDTLARTLAESTSYARLLLLECHLGATGQLRPAYVFGFGSLGSSRTHAERGKVRGMHLGSIASEMDAVRALRLVWTIHPKRADLSTPPRHIVHL